MRKLIVTAALIAFIPGTAAMSQETRVTTTVTMQGPSVVNPDAGVRFAAPRQPGPDGIIRVMGPQQAVTQAVPPPAAAYPPCKHGRTDSCYNPNPGKEADVRRDGTIGE